MLRRWTVRGDDDTGEVSRGQMMEAFADAEAILARAGGTISVVTMRAPTDIDGEMVTVGAMFEWKDRTDGQARPQPETAAAPLEGQNGAAPALAVAPPVEPPPPLVAAAPPAPPAPVAPREPHEPPPPAGDDGLPAFVSDVEEDDTSIPAELRG